MELQHILTYALKRSFGYCVRNELEFRQEWKTREHFDCFCSYSGEREMVGGLGCWQWRVRGARFETHFPGLVAGLQSVRIMGRKFEN